MSGLLLLPFEPLDKLCLAAVRAPFSSCAPTWRLFIRGRLELGWIRSATANLLARYPSIASRVVAVDGSPLHARKFAWQVDEKPNLDQLVFVSDQRAATEAEQLRISESLADHCIDLHREYPLRITWLRLPDRDGEPRSALFLQQQHALADGRAFLKLIGELISALDAAARGLPAVDLGPVIPRRAERSVFAEQGFARLRAVLRGVFETVRLAASGMVAPSRPLFCNLGSDSSGGDRSVHLEVEDSRRALWKTARQKLALSENDLLAGALAAALARWSARHGTKAGRTRMVLIADARPRDRAFDSFANHLASLFAVLPLGKVDAPLDLAQTIAQQVRLQVHRRAHLVRLLSESALVQAVPISWIRRSIFEKPKLFANYMFSNLIPLGTPGADANGFWRGQGFVVESLQITTPTLPPQGASTTVARYGGKLVFNFNYKASVLNRSQMQDLAASFEEALAEVDARLAG